MPPAVHDLSQQTALEMRNCSPRAAELRSHSAVETAANESERDFPTVLLAMAGHDLRQPLQIITSAHDVLATMVAERAQREELARAVDATSSLATMLSQIVEALQLYELPYQHGGDVVLLGPLLEELWREFSWTARSKGIRFTIDPTRAAVHSHPVLLRAILRNLVRNAVDYTPRGGRVSISCRSRGASLRIAVQDSGVGIRPHVLAKIFSAFERADDTRADGLGLGLFIAKRAAELVNHRLHVRSLLGHGSCFSVDAEAAPVPARSSDRIAGKTVRRAVSREHAIEEGKEEAPGSLVSATPYAHSSHRAQGLLATG